MDLYAENILDHYRHPRHSGTLTDATVSHHEENASCGDDLTLELLLENDIVKDLRWQGSGCALSQAGMSILSEELVGMTLAKIDALTPAHIHEVLGVPVGPRRTKCALLCLHTLRNAIRRSRGERPQSWLETVQIDNEG